MRENFRFLKFFFNISLYFIIACFISSNVFAQDPNFYIFLAFGQSNMEGNATVENQDKGNVNERFQFMSAVNCPNQNRTAGQWTVAEPPLCRCNTGLNPCDYFGRSLVDSLPEDIKVGVINVSVAGCAIEMFDKDIYQSYVSGQADWLKNIANEYGGNPYAKLVELAKAAQQDGVIKGFLLHQGESGSSTGQWANEVKKIYNDLIEDLELDASEIPLLVGDLVRPSNMIQSLPNTLENAHVISSQGLEERGDGLHFNASGYREFGRRYAAKMLELLGDPIIPVEKPLENPGYGLWNEINNTSGSASITFQIPSDGSVTITAHGIDGNKIAELVKGDYTAGKHSLLLKKKDLPSGMHILKMESGDVSTSGIVWKASR